MDPTMETAPTEAVAERPGVVLGGGSQRHRVTGEMVHHLGRLPLSPGAAPQAVDLPFLAHGLTPSPHDEGLIVLFEKHGPGACVLDLRQGVIVHTLHAGEGREFYGHGVFSRDGSLLYCTETDVTDGNRGVLAVRDGKDFSVLGELPSYGVAPHDCVLWGDGDVLVVTNGGSPIGVEEHPPNVAFVDLKTHALLDEVRPSNPRINTGHVAVASGGELAVISAPRDGLSPAHDLGGVSLRGKDGPLRTVTEPLDVLRDLKGETLSVAIHEPTRTVAATTPLGHYLTLWELDTGRLRKSLRLPEPRGVAVSLDGKDFILNFGNPPRMARLDAFTLEPPRDPEARAGFPSLCTGSHILVADLPGWA
ncbi:DUF1513 domain-containing protein [Paraliomyxa miuraensis]|uniref:DUF1513 domain-containing protein n=1 Tax=Paraliomyxa miuraensis TaxID=376150 RepID=UPI00225B164C|nr:DUF1513 domain-containing protein [Paraliomyxa miuraensis]MCX4240752.1 DUF1513 domain-containing protein [Paraliomyxa miuraensis]